MTDIELIQRAGDMPIRNTRRQSGKRGGISEQELSSKENVQDFEGHFRELFLFSLGNGDSMQVLEDGMT